MESRCFRPAEVEALLGDATKAKAKLGWTPKIGFDQMVAEMVEADFIAASREEKMTGNSVKIADPQE